jgi:hypothetical protein
MRYAVCIAVILTGSANDPGKPESGQTGGKGLRESQPVIEENVEANKNIMWYFIE